MADIPLSWNDPMFSGVTSSGSVTLKNGATLSNRSITDTGNIASVVGNGSFTLDGVRISSREGVRIGGDGDVTISNSYLESRGQGNDHADTIQVYAPGSTGNITITNTTIVAHNTAATAGMFVADEWSGTLTFNNVVFQGGPFGLRVATDADDISVALKDVYFVGPFGYDELLFQEVTADIHITQWDNVRYATIVNGELVPGALISPPFPVEGGGSTPNIPEIGAPTIVSLSDDSGIAGDGITNDSTVTLKGTATANSTVKVFDSAKAIGTVTAASNGAWSFTSAALADGAHKFTATATSSGVTSGASTARFVTVDTVAPTAPTLKMSTSAATLASTHVAQLTGTAEANSAVKVFDGSTQIGTATANNSGAWTFTTKSLANGGHSFTAKAMDAAGNTGAASTALAVTIVPDAQGVPSAPSSPTAPPTTSPTPTLGKVIESAGATSLVESGDKYYLNSSSGSGPSLKYHGVDFVDGTDGTWAPIAAEKTTAGYQVVWKEASTGLYTAWNTDNNGNYVSHVSTLTGSTSGGAVSGKSFGLKLLETSFHQDLNGDGQIGASSAAAPTQINSTDQVVATSDETMVGTNRSDTLTSTTGNDIMVGKGGADTFVFASNFGNDVITDFTAGGSSHDTVQFSKSVFDSFADILAHATQVGRDVVITADHGDSLTLKNVKMAALDKWDFHLA